MQPIKLYIVADDEPFVISERMLTGSGVTEQDLRVRFGEHLQVHIITLKENINTGMHLQAEKRCLTPEGYDPTLLPAARAAVYVQEWTFPQPVSMEGFHLITPPVAGLLLSEEINHAVYPSFEANPDFLALLKARQGGSSS